MKFLNHKYTDESYTKYEELYNIAESNKDGYDYYYDNSYMTYKNNLKNAFTKQTNFNEVKDIAKNAVEDFKDNYIVDGNYDKNSVEKKVSGAKTELKNISDLKNLYNGVYETLNGLEADAESSANALKDFEFDLYNGGTENNNENIDINPGTPDNPDNPDTPDNPDNPDTPDNPETPGDDVNTGDDNNENEDEDEDLSNGFYAVVTKYPKLTYLVGEEFCLDGLTFDIYDPNGERILCRDEDYEYWWMDYDDIKNPPDMTAEGTYEFSYSYSNGAFKLPDGTYYSYKPYGYEELDYVLYTVNIPLTVTVNAQSKTLTVIYPDDPKNLNFSGYNEVNITFTDETEDVDVLDLWEYKNRLCEIPESPRAINISYPASVKSLTINLPTDKTNVELMNSIANPDLDLRWEFEAEGQTIEKDLVYGVKLVTYSKEWYDKENYNNVYQQAFKFTDKTKGQKVNMQNAKIDLQYSYQGTGLIGEKLELSGIGENTELSGNMYKDGIDNIYDTFIDDKGSNLPTLDTGINILNADYDMYGTKLPDIIAEYYNNDLGGRLTFVAKSDIGIDAKEYLNGNSMYKGNTYNNNAYNLDINAALVMAGDYSNLTITGENKVVGESELNSNMLNVRFESDMVGIKFTTGGGGVLDFAGGNPALTPYLTYGKLIIRKLSNTDLL